jgi:hypothetical protein
MGGIEATMEILRDFWEILQTGECQQAVLGFFANDVEY